MKRSSSGKIKSIKSSKTLQKSNQLAFQRLSKQLEKAVYSVNTNGLLQLDIVQLAQLLQRIGFFSQFGQEKAALTQDGQAEQEWYVQLWTRLTSRLKHQQTVSSTLVIKLLLSFIDPLTLKYFQDPSEHLLRLLSYDSVENDLESHEFSIESQHIWPFSLFYEIFLQLQKNHINTFYLRDCLQRIETESRKSLIKQEDMRDCTFEPQICDLSREIDQSSFVLGSYNQAS